MAAQVPQSFRNGSASSGKPFHFHYVQVIFLVVLSMSALCLEVTSLAQAQPHDDLTPGEKSAPEASTEAIPELEILREETESISRGLLEERPISEAPSNVYVITDEDIRHSGATDIPTVLRRIPGMEVIQMTGADFNVSVRGNNQTAANKLLVLVDGRPIYEYAFGSVFWTLLPITLPEIKKIEVWKGPAAAIFGFNAFDGVVNIITKSPQEMKGNTNGTLVQFGGGEYGTIRSAAIQAGKHGNFGYRLSFGHDQNQKWSNRDALALRSNKFNLHTEYQLRDNSKILFAGGLVDSNRFDGQVFDIFHESSKIANGYLSLAYERSNFFIRGSWTRWDENRLELMDPVFNGIAVTTDRNGDVNQTFKHDVYTLWGQHTVPLSKSNQFLYGFNYFHNAVTNVNVFDDAAQEDRLGLYLQDEWQATSSLTFVAGMRMDMITDINPTYSPRVALIYRPVADHSFRLSGSVGYRPPSILESRSDIRTTIIPFGLTFVGRGSRDLKPEQIVSYEAEYQGWYLKHRLRVRAAAFFNHISDFISTVPSPSDPSLFVPANFGQADLYGGEVGAEFLATSWLTGFVNYSTVQLHQTSDLVQAQSISTRGAPPIKVNAGLRGEWENGFSAEGLVHYVSAATYPVAPAFSAFAPIFGFLPPDPRVGAYTLLNLRGAYRFWHEKAEVAIAVFNALNDRHRESPTGDVIGSRVMGWLTLRY